MTHISIHLSIQQTSVECPIQTRGIALGIQKMSPLYFIYSLSTDIILSALFALSGSVILSPIVQVGKLELTEIKLMSEALTLVSSWDSNLTQSPAEPVPLCPSWALSPWLHS